MLVLMYRPIVLLAVLTILGGCQPIEQAPPPLHPHDHPVDPTAEPVASAVTPPPKTEPVTEPAEHAHEDTAPKGAIVPRATIEHVEPGHEGLAQAIVAASKTSLDECRANSGGGALRVRIVSTKSSAKITVESDTKISPKVRHCVIEALSTLDVPDTLSNSSPSMKPSAGFTSIIAVNW